MKTMFKEAQVVWRLMVTAEAILDLIIAHDKKAKYKKGKLMYSKRSEAGYLIPSS